MRPSAVSIIVLAWPPNQARRRNVLTLLESLGRTADPAGIEVVAVCNGDDERLAARLRRHPRVDRTLTPGANLGVAPGWNLALAEASGDVVIVANEDAILGDCSVERLCDALRDERVGLVAPVVNRWSRRNLFPIRGARVDASEFVVPGGYLLAMRRAVYDRVGGFDERLAPLFFEEVDLALRLQGAGYRIDAAVDSGVLHEWGVSRSVRSRSIEWSGGNETIGRIHRRNHRRMLARWSDQGWRASPALHPFVYRAGMIRDRIARMDLWRQAG